MKLTTEQIKNQIEQHKSKITQLQEELKKSSYITGFERVEEDEKYFSIDNDGKMFQTKEYFPDYDEQIFEIANYGSEKRMSLLEKKNRLQRLMYRFSVENGGDNIDWSDVNQRKYFLYYNYTTKSIIITWYNDVCHVDQTYFISEDVAEQALEKFGPLMREVIKEEREVRKYYLELNSKEKLTSSYKFELGRKFIIDGFEYKICHIEETKNGAEYHIAGDEGELWDIHTESELEKIILRGSFDE